MTAVAEILSQVHLGSPQRHRNLSVIPLLASARVDPGYLLLDQALAEGLVRVMEVSESGSVPELKLVNDAEQPVLLLDGEELVGAKQNRILNVTVLAPPRAALVIPVSCVEAGRWHHTSAEFRTSDRTHYASGRAKKTASVSESLRRERSHRSDQAAVWEDITAMSERLEASSPTAAAAALYETHRASLEEYVKAFTAEPAQGGALFAVNGAVAGLDLFDSPATLRRLLPKLVRSYALDAIDRVGENESAPEAEGARFLDDVRAAREEAFPAVGLGQDLRLSGAAVTGGALLHEAKVVHLCAFRLPGKGEATDGDSGTSMARSSLRRRSWL